MAINFFSQEISFNLSNKKKIKDWIKQVVVAYDYEVGDINFIFTSEEHILSINQEYLNHDYFTDIITFPYTEGRVISSDIFISIPTVKSNAEAFGQTFLYELNRVIVHGVLHLVGFTDTTEKQQLEMRNEENKWLSALNSI